MRRSSSLRLAGFVVPRRVRVALTKRPVDAASLQAELLDLARRLADHADARAISTADDLVTLVSHAVAREPVEQGAFALRLFVICVPYFDRIGRPDVPPRLARHLMRCARAWPGAWARRCAHQFAAVVQLQADHAWRAWAHAECAFELAADFDASPGRFETLVGVVGILDNMGLLNDAKALALQLLDGPEGDASLDRLHLLNAINGLSLCDRLDDLRTGSRFCEAGVARVVAAGAANAADAAGAAAGLDVVGAHFEAAHARHLVRLGSPRLAARQLDDALCRSTDCRPRVEALLRSAQIEVYAAVDDPVRVGAALQRLKSLLPAFHDASAFHRDMLRTIVRCELWRGGGDTAVASRYLELLRERPSPVCSASTGSTDVLLQNLLTGIVGGVAGASSETDARSYPELATRDRPRNPWPGRRFADFGFQCADAAGTAVVLTLPEREAALRTPAFEVAENWAVVAEIVMGGDGRQCFKVGRVAAALAAALGLSDERIVLVELACRLRNVGDATIACGPANAKPRASRDPGLVVERTQAGARILSFSVDPVLRSAARIAANHHAWWNGNGVPGDLRGDAIPIEARICAVADHLVSLVDPIGSRRPWPIELALRQLHCMAGVQLDPELVGLLGRVLHDEGMRVEDPAWRLHAALWNDPFAKARKHLIETFELAV